MATKTREQMVIRNGNGVETKFSAEYGSVTILTDKFETIQIGKTDWIELCKFIDSQLSKYIVND